MRAVHLAVTKVIIRYEREPSLVRVRREDRLVVGSIGVSHFLIDPSRPEYDV